MIEPNLSNICSTNQLLEVTRKKQISLKRSLITPKRENKGINDAITVSQNVHYKMNRN